MTSQVSPVPATVTPGRAAAFALTTWAWYALPDVVRSRPARAVLKTGLLALGGAAWALAGPQRPVPAEPQGPDTADELLEAIRAQPGAALALGTATLGLGTAVSILGEKAIFRFGERRRARGVRGAHTWPALGLGVLAAASVIIPVP